MNFSLDIYSRSNKLRESLYIYMFFLTYFYEKTFIVTSKITY